ncbi:16S rRNA (guanine(527)-N(7))-methyltransferase RsmG [Chroococcidiopsis sp. CCMEE 29]|uniref:16S rRNA (guanine(527)-N(7))-methyltransferase RsmG n=1 Tax=Chroococcidiopsis sp. CCMEE 29 TaxID=155894 RepID=UPI00201FDCB3|nr:16S rRNA (guanine(527)-N(7))-methyltransferase RsmG [Chroococcidiopsis sp. CCMEE 29]
MPETDTPLLPEMSQLWQQSLNWQPTTQQQRQFQCLYELILAGNRQLNLTRITDPLEFWEKHLWDSLRGIAPLLEGRGIEEQGEQGKITNSSFILHPSSFKVIDIGTGAGFPGIPVAIALPDSNVILLDSTRKKITFLNTLITQLGIQNMNTLIGRAEIVGKQPQHRQTFDIALIRAVGSASICAEYALPFLKVGGLAVLYRGNWTTDETETLQTTVKQLGGVIEAAEGFTTPLSQSIRHCVYLRKVAHTTRSEEEDTVMR